LNMTSMKQKSAVIIGVIGVVLIVSVFVFLRTSSNSNEPAFENNSLSALRTPYVGAAGAVGKIVASLLPLDADHVQRFFSIGDDYGTDNAPYTLTVYYEYHGNEKNEARDITSAPINAAILFSLIDNLQEVSFAFRPSPSDGVLDQAAYASRISFDKDNITEFIGSLGLDWEDFLLDWDGAMSRMLVQ